MSNSVEKDEPQNPTEESGVSGLEIMEVVNYQSYELHSKVASIVRLMVSEVTTKIKETLKVPVTENSEMAIVAVPASSSSYKSEDSDGTGRPARKRTPMTTSILVGGFSVNFELPEHIIEKNIDMDQVASSYHSYPVENEEIYRRAELQFSSRERLENWDIECRQRPNGRCDVFYHHQKSRKWFRSISEVVNFLLYEIYPENYKRENKLAFSENQEAKQVAIEESSSGRRKMKSSWRGGRRRKRRRRRMKANEESAEDKAMQVEEAAIEEEEEQESSTEEEIEEQDIITENSTKRHEEEKENVPGKDKKICTYSDLLNISEDWTAYENLLYEYFD